MSSSNRFRRRGTTLIEVAIGSMMMAILILPTLAAMNQSESLRRRHESHRVMLFTAEEQLEQEKVLLSDSDYFDSAWGSAIGSDVTKKIVIDDGPDLVCRTRLLADPSVGSTPARLVSVTVDVWRDTNGDRQLDSLEPHETVQTQWASP